MPYEPTALERQASLATTEARDDLHRAQSLLDVGESAPFEDERRHGPAIGPGERRKLVMIAEVAAELGAVAGDAGAVTRAARGGNPSGAPWRARGGRFPAWAPC